MAAIKIAVPIETTAADGKIAGAENIIYTKNGKSRTQAAVNDDILRRLVVAENDYDPEIVGYDIKEFNKDSIVVIARSNNESKSAAIRTTDVDFKAFTVNECTTSVEVYVYDGSGAEIGKFSIASGVAGFILVQESIDEVTATFTPISGVAWGQITGNLASQTDLKNALNAKQATLKDTAGAGKNFARVNGKSLLTSIDVAIKETVVVPTGGYDEEDSLQSNVTAVPSHSIATVTETAPDMPHNVALGIPEGGGDMYILNLMDFAVEVHVFNNADNELELGSFTLQANHQGKIQVYETEYDFEFKFTDSFIEATEQDINDLFLKKLVQAYFTGGEYSEIDCWYRDDDHTYPILNSERSDSVVLTRPSDLYSGKFKYIIGDEDGDIIPLFFGTIHDEEITGTGNSSYMVLYVNVDGNLVGLNISSTEGSVNEISVLEPDDESTPWPMFEMSKDESETGKLILQSDCVAPYFNDIDLDASWSVNCESGLEYLKTILEYLADNEGGIVLHIPDSSLGDIFLHDGSISRGSSSNSYDVVWEGEEAGQEYRCEGTVTFAGEDSEFNITLDPIFL